MEILAVLALGVLLLLGRRGRRGRSPRPGAVIAGKAYVTDGDGIRVAGRDVRLAGIDAPECDQWAKRRDGVRVAHGRIVKSALIGAVGGKRVRVAVEGRDRYGRIVGVATCAGKDVGAWLVRHGYAIAAYDDRYRAIEREARRERRGLWGYDTTFDPRAWRRRKR